jgi:hypothetical protein
MIQKKFLFISINPIVFIGAICLLILLNSCLMNYPVYNSTAPTKPTKQETIQLNISNYTTSKFIEKGTYKSFQFGELFVTKPAEIKQLDDLIEIRNTLPLMEEHYGDKLDSIITKQDALIEAKKSEIKTKNIYPIYEMSHLFSISVSKDLFEIYEFDYSLYPNYTVKDVKQLMFLELTNKEYQLFLHLSNQRPLFTSNPSLDPIFYTQFFTALDAEKNFKPELLKNILKIIEYILRKDNFDEMDFCQSIAKDWVFNNPIYIEPKTDGFSKNELIQILVSDTNNFQKLVGYNLTYLFTVKEKEARVQKKLDFDFDLNFLLTRVRQIE